MRQSRDLRHMTQKLRCGNLPGNKKQIGFQTFWFYVVFNAWTSLVVIILDSSWVQRGLRLSEDFRHMTQKLRFGNLPGDEKPAVQCTHGIIQLYTVKFSEFSNRFWFIYLIIWLNLTIKHHHGHTYKDFKFSIKEKSIWTLNIQISVYIG